MTIFKSQEDILNNCLSPKTYAVLPFIQKPQGTYSRESIIIYTSDSILPYLCKGIKTNIISIVFFQILPSEFHIFCSLKNYYY